MNTDLFRSYLAVIKAGNFHQAARARGISQAAVSLHVQKLEVLIAARLLDRSHRGCTPTPTGLELVPHAEAVVRAADRALTLGHRSECVVAASTNIGTYLLQPYVSAFRNALEKGQKLSLHLDTNPNVADALAQDEADVALMEWWDGRPGFLAKMWRNEPIVVIFRPGHPWEKREAIEPDELFTEKMLGGERGTGTGRQLNERFGSESGWLRCAENLGSTAAVKEATKAGAGISLVMKSSVQDELRAGTLSARSIAGAPLYKTIWLVHRALSEASLSYRFALFLCSSV